MKKKNNDFTPKIVLIRARDVGILSKREEIDRKRQQQSPCIWSVTSTLRVRTRSFLC